MKYFLLTATVIAGALKSIVTKLSGKRGSDFLETAKINLISFSCALFVVFLFALSDLNAFSVPLWLAACYAASTLASQICLTKAVALGSVSVSSLFYSCGFIIPTIWGNLYYKEGIGILHIVGAAMTVLSFALSSEGGKKEAFRLKWLAFALGGMLFSGIVGVIQKYFTNSYAEGSVGCFLVAAFCMIVVIDAVLYAAARFLYERKKKTDVKEERATAECAGSSCKKTLLFTVALGVIIGLGNMINTYLSGVFPSIIAFPVINGGAIVLSTVLSRLFLKERLSAVQWAGVVVGVTGIVLLALGQTK